MLMRVALVYVLTVISAVLAFALFWQEGRLANVQESFLKASNELAAKTAEVDSLRQKKTLSEERAFFAEARLRELQADHDTAAGQLSQLRRLQEETQGSLTKTQAQAREADAAKVLAEGRATELQSQVERLTGGLETSKGNKPKAAAVRADEPKTDTGKSAAETAADAPLQQKVMIEPDPATPASSPVITNSVTPAGTEAVETPADKPTAVRKTPKTAASAKRKPRPAAPSEFFFPF